jgi:hypothetical protein
MANPNAFPFIQCCTENCFKDLRDYVGPQNYNILRDKGLVEYSSICGGAFVCRLLAFKDEVNMQLSDFLQLITRLLDKGIIVKCTDVGQTVFASTETYLKYAEAVGETQSAAVPA